MKKLVLYARSGQNKLYPLIAKKIANVFNYCYIVQNDEEEKTVRILDTDKSIKIYNLSSFIKNNWENEEYLNIDISKFESKYNIASIWSLFYIDRFLIKYNYEDSIKFIKLHIAFSEMILELERPDYFINEEIALFFPLLFSKISSSFNCRYIAFSVPRNFSNSKFIFKNADGEYDELNEIYANKKLSEQELKKSREVLNNIIQSREKPQYMNNTGQKPRLHLKYIYGFLKYFASYFKVKNKFNYVDVDIRSVYLENTVFYFRQLAQRKFFKRPTKGDKYILFPLHYTPEASTLVAAPFYEKQLTIIDFLAKSIPADMLLYVKEHYARIGHKETNFYVQIVEKYPNVRLIDPWLDSFDLIDKAKGIAVLTSTAGWEALMMQKPLLIFGDVFYEKFKYANKIELLSSKTLPSIIKKILETKIDKAVYDLEFNYFFASYLKAMKTGNYCLGQKDIISEKNVEDLSTSLVEYLVQG